MHFKQLLSWLMVLSVSFIPSLVRSDELTTLKLTPNLCVPEADQDTCTVEVLVEYQLPLAVDACLWQSDKVEALKCVEAAQQVKSKITVNTDHDVVIKLLDLKSNLIAQGEFTISKYEPVRPRPRRGLGWNLL
jgi:hypothetical protein